MSHAPLILALETSCDETSAALFHYRRGETAGLDLTARADLPFPGLVGR